jgi:hypothetical protein
MVDVDEPANTAAASPYSYFFPSSSSTPSSSPSTFASAAASASSSASSSASASAAAAINKEPLLLHIAKILVGKHQKRDLIIKFVREFVWVMDFLNRCDWETDPRNVHTFQKHVDRMGDALIAVWGDVAITNYFHDLIAGHVMEMMLVFGPLYRLTQEAAERSNSENVKWELGHSQRGGNCNRADGTKAERGISTALHHGRMILRKAGKADEILDDAERKDAELRVAARAARRAALLPGEQEEEEEEEEGDYFDDEEGDDSDDEEDESDDEDDANSAQDGDESDASCESEDEFL